MGEATIVRFWSEVQEQNSSVFLNMSKQEKGIGWEMEQYFFHKDMQLWSSAEIAELQIGYCKYVYISLINIYLCEFHAVKTKNYLCFINLIWDHSIWDRLIISRSWIIPPPPPQKKAYFAYSTH